MKSFGCLAETLVLYSLHNLLVVESCNNQDQEHKMALKGRRDFMLLISVIFVIEEVSTVSSLTLHPCSNADFEMVLLSCDENTTIQSRNAAFYMHTPCDLSHNDSIPHPKNILGIPCYCDPGSGKKTNTSLKCVKCDGGHFSHGGEFIDDWSEWNYPSESANGLLYRADSYCSDFLTTKSCHSWRPSGDGTFLISGNFKNSTELRCFEQSILVMTRKFVRDAPHNKISFEYKVDGAPCRKNARGCSHGLHLFINGKLRLKRDTQFHWTVNVIDNLEPGYNKFKFVYHKSCTREAVLDVAYLKHIAFIGTDAANIPCTKCKKGTFSNTEGQSECKKCPANTYQDEEGKTQCKRCAKDNFSRIGAVECSKLPLCRETDYYVRPNNIDTCVKKKDGLYYRPQTVGLPQWPGYAVCRNDSNTKIPDNSQIQCQCTPGLYLKQSQDKGQWKVDCKKCDPGTYSDGKMMTCKKCPQGEAAVPGFYIDLFDGDRINGLIKQICSGFYCSQGKDIWVPRGSYMANRRTPGDFEATFKFENVKIVYHEAKLNFNCSVDCRMEANGTHLAKHDHCFFRIILQKYNETSKRFESVREVDCVNGYRHIFRNGTIQQHEYPIEEEGTYTFMALFHQEDEANYSLVSYEARLYHADIYGAEYGTARGCTKCKSGTELDSSGTYCIKCPNGTFSNETTKCLPCPDGHFADKEGSAQCIPCGTGTTANSNKDGCDYKGCTFEPRKGVKYDLSPLSRDGGSMYLVRTNRSRHYIPLYYYINICSLNHDNSSCYTTSQKKSRTSFPDRHKNENKYELLRTMACKRWSFNTKNSFSIGEVLNFKEWTDNISNGLKIVLERGYNCWSKKDHEYQKPVTTILMECDMFAGIGFPEAMDNKTGVDSRDCNFNIRWRSFYACPLCHEDNYKEIKGECVDGKQTITRIKGSVNCRSNDSHDDTIFVSEEHVCYAAVTITQPSKQTPFVVAIVISVLVVVLLLMFVVYYARRNRSLRERIFVPGKSFSKVREEDEFELVDDAS